MQFKRILTILRWFRNPSTDLLGLNANLGIHTGLHLCSSTSVQSEFNKHGSYRDSLACSPTLPMGDATFLMDEF